MLGIALVDKPQGPTSHDTIYKVRRALGIRKIGHAGTLDPNATGLLVMAVGDATRFLPYLQTDPKTYEGMARLGVSTNTQDSEGEVIDERPVKVGLDEVRDAGARFVGTIRQVPPMYSAVQVDGQRLYKLARKGVEVKRDAREVQVYDLKLGPFEGDDLRFEVTCSAGTYVRTLLHDLGEALGCGAHLTALRRTRSGRFSVQEAVEPEQVSAEILMPLEGALSHMSMVRLPEPVTAAARHGNEFAYLEAVEGEHLGLLDEEGFFAVARRSSPGRWRPERVLPPKTE